MAKKNRTSEQFFEELTVGNYRFGVMRKPRCLNPNCGKVVREGKYRCDACQSFKNKHGGERPKGMIALDRK